MFNPEKQLAQASSSLSLDEIMKQSRRENWRKMEEWRAKMSAYDNPEFSSIDNHRRREELSTLERMGFISLKNNRIETHPNVQFLRPGSKNDHDGFFTRQDISLVEDIVPGIGNSADAVLRHENHDVLETEAENVIANFEAAIKNKEWQQALTLMEDLHDFDVRIVETDILEKMNEIYLRAPFEDAQRPLPTNSSSAESKNEWYSTRRKNEKNALVIEKIGTYLIEKMRARPQSVPYLEKIAQRKQIPEIFKDAYYTSREGSDAIGDADFEYLNKITGVLWYHGTPQSYEIIQEIGTITEQMLKEKIHARNTYQEELWKEAKEHPEMLDATNLELMDESTFLAYGQERSLEFEKNYKQNSFGKNQVQQEWIPDEESEYEHVKELGEFEIVDYEQSYVDLHRNIIQALGHSGEKKYISSIVEFLQKQRTHAPHYEASALESFQALGKNIAATKLIDIAKKGNSLDRRIALSALFKLENDRLPVGPQGVTYLQKRFDLSEYNNGDDKYQVSRITSGGQVGIFEKANGNLVKFFALDRLNTEDAVIRAQLHSLTYETLFTPKTNETGREREERENLLEEYKQNYQNFLQGDFLTETGVRFSDLTFREQAEFMLLHQSSDEDKKLQLQNFCRTFGINGFRSLLATRYNKNVTEMLLQETDNPKRDKTKKLLEAYALIVTTAEQSNELLTTYFTPTENSEDIYQTLEETILVKGASLLEKALTESQQTKDFKPESAIRQLLHINKRILFITNAYKAKLGRGETTNLRDIVGMDYKVMPATDINKEKLGSSSLKQRMEDIYRQNYEGQYSKTLINSLIAGFENSLNDPNAVYHLYIDQEAEKGPELVDFDRFDFETDGETGTPYLHFAAVNLNPNYGGGKLGNSAVRETLDWAAQFKQPIRGETIPTTDIAKEYISTFDFTANDITWFENKIPILSIEQLPAQGNDLRFSTKKLKDIAQVREFAIRHTAADAETPVLKVPRKEFNIASAEQNWEPLRLYFTKLEQGFHLTQFMDDKKDGYVYLVYEKPTSHEKTSA